MISPRRADDGRRAAGGGSRGGGGGSYGGKGGRPMKMRSKRMGALRSTGGGRYEQDFGAPPPPPRPCAAAPASNGVVPPPTPTPTPTPQRPQQADEEPVAGFDVTALPRHLDAAFDKLDGDACLRPTTIKSSTPWRVSSQKGLLSATKQTTYDSDRLATEKRKAFELLDALTRSGAIPLLSTQLHVVVAATHHARPRRGGDRDPRQREPNPQGGTVVSPRGVDAVRRGAPDPGRAVARAGARHGA